MRLTKISVSDAATTQQDATLLSDSSALQAKIDQIEANGILSRRRKN
jgi:hypothetical protein